MTYKFANNMLTEHHILSMGLCLTLTTSDGSSGMLGMPGEREQQEYRRANPTRARGDDPGKGASSV